MRCMILAVTQTQAAPHVARLENLGESWRCEVCLDAASAYRRLCETCFGLCLICPGPQAEQLRMLVQSRPPLAPPWLLRPGDAIPSGLPPLALARLPQVTCLSRSLLTALTAQHLRAWAFLPDMTALTVVHPPLLGDLRSGLYPLVGRRHGLSAAAVERSLRTLVEATWSRGSLSALERFFGCTVDPEKGKPTNKEFLCCLHQRLTLAARRLV